MIDSGSSVSLVGKNFVETRTLGRDTIRLETMDGGTFQAHGSLVISSIVADGVEMGPVKAFVMPRLPLGVDFVLGFDVVSKHGLTVRVIEGRVLAQLGIGPHDLQRQESGSMTRVTCNIVSTHTEPLRIEDEDFSASFQDGKWTVTWHWNGKATSNSDHGAMELVSDEDKEGFDAELASWLEEGILVRYDKRKHGDIEHYLPMIAVRQKKGDEVKVRPVLDYRQLNEAIQSHPGGATPICNDMLRKWRQWGSKCATVDLKRAYLQIHIDPKLWKFQAVRWNGETFLLTRLGFGLASAPKVMTRIVEAVIGADSRLKGSVSSYIDDLFVNESQVCVTDVIDHLKCYGLICKPPETLGERDVRILGVKVDNHLKWTRDAELPVVPDKPTRREVHQLVGVWCGHYPVGSWLRVACGFIQRCTAHEGLKWDECVSDTVADILRDVDKRLRENDPVRGEWLVDMEAPMIIWADASNLAVGAALEVNGRIVEDAAWMRPKKDSRHINCAELDAVIRGLNMALRWGHRKLMIKTDSATVRGWLEATLRKTHNVKTRALSEVLIRRRLEILRAIVEEESLDVEVELVRSSNNKADQLTRVPARWLQREKNDEAVPVSLVTLGDVANLHKDCHFGVEKTLELAREKYGESVSRTMVKKVVSRCEACARVDPSLTFRFDRGSIASRGVWDKLALDLTHVGNHVFLTVVDVHSGYTVWRKLNNEGAREASEQMRQLFSMFGPPRIVLSDNGSIFRGREFQELLMRWQVEQQLSCAYRAQGNGVVERIHRTVKRSVRRSGRSVEDIVFWYNNTRGRRGLSPYEIVFGMTCRKPGVSEVRSDVDRSIVDGLENANCDDLYEQEERNPFTIGDKVYLRPSSGRCDDVWTGPHTVTKLNSSVSVVIDEDGVSRHVSHLRLVPGSRDFNASEIERDGRLVALFRDSGSSGPDDSGEETDVDEGLRRGSRVRKRPIWWGDYDFEV